MDTQVINKNAKNGNAKETLKKGAALAGAEGLGEGAVVSADIVRGDEELAIVEPISPMDEEVIGQNAEDAVTAEENKPFLHLKAIAVHLLFECLCRNVKTGRRTEKACELRITPGEVFLLPHEGKQFSDHIGEKQFGRVKAVAYRFPCVNLLAEP